MFRDFVKEHNPKDMLDVDEFLAMRKEVLAELSKDGGGEKKKEEEENKEETDESSAPGEEGDADSEKPATDEENSAMREKMIFGRKKVSEEVGCEIKETGGEFSCAFAGFQGGRGGGSGTLEVRGQHQEALLPHEASREGAGNLKPRNDEPLSRFWGENIISHLSV